MADDPKAPDLKAGVSAAKLKTDGAMVLGVVDGDAVMLARWKGELFAVSNACTHLGGPLNEGVLVEGQARCPWHQARFSLKTGEAVGAPALQPLDCYKVEERDAKIYVTGKREASKPEPVAKGPGRVVIIGGGAAGHACADLLARRGLAKMVWVISADQDPPYDRTFCSKQYLSGEEARAKTDLDHNRIYKTGVTLVTGAVITGIDVKTKSVRTDTGEIYPYDSLVLATGSEPIVLGTPGFDHPKVFTLRSLRDADALIAAAKSSSCVAIVGASFIGLEAAAAMVQRKLKVEVIAPETVPLAKVLGEAAGRFIQQTHEEKGVVFHLGRKAERFDGQHLELDDGSKVKADFVIVGAGVEPRVNLAKAAGLDLAAPGEGGGILVDDHLRTSVNDIYAVGDIAHYPDRRVGQIRVEHWVHAERQGQYVARQLLGENAPYDDIPFFWTNHYDRGVGYVGHANNPATAEVKGSPTNGEFVIRYFEKDKVVAMATANHDLEALQFGAEQETKG